MLHQFNQAAFPRPLLLFSQKQATIPIQSIQGLHQDNIWSGAEFEMVFDLEVFSAKILEITLKGWRPEPIEKIIPNLKISINGNNLIFSQSQQTQITFQIPPETLLSHQNTLLILCPTFSTQKDPRKLGLDLETIVLR